MQINEYQQLTEKTELYTKAAENFITEIENGNYAAIRAKTDFLKLMYCVGKLNGEAGEIAEKVFKAFRDNEGVIEHELREALFKELGDVCWYIARISAIMGFGLEEVMKHNINKLADRKERGVLSGSGDNR